MREPRISVARRWPTPEIRVVEAVAPEAWWRRPAPQITLLFLVIVAFLFLFVFPTRAFLAQRSETNSVRNQLHMLRQQNTSLQREAKQLQSSAEIERIARGQYNLVKPGEKAYAIIPQGAASTNAPTGSNAPGSLPAGASSADVNDAPTNLTTRPPNPTAPPNPTGSQNSTAPNAPLPGAPTP